jgi:putative lipoprotein
MTGTVTYWERIALLPDAELHVALSVLGAPEPIAELSQPINGGQVPIAFTLAYPESQIDEEQTYLVTAEIRYDERTAFVTSDPVAVITQGNPATDVAIRVHTSA